MAFTLVASGTAQSPNTNGFTCSAFNAAGANLLVVVAVSLVGQDGPISDSTAASWTDVNVGTYNHRFGVWFASVTGQASHTITIGGTGNYPAFAYYAFASAGLLDQATTPVTGSSVSTLQPGSLTPANAGSVLVTGIASNSPEAWSIDSGFATPLQTPNSPGFAYGVAASYQIQTTATARNPTWSWAGSDNLTTMMAVFSLARSAGTSGTLDGSTEVDVRAGGKTFIVTLTGDSFIEV